ncbi:hypothetical protein [Catenulispora subtropica]
MDPRSGSGAPRVVRILGVDAGSGSLAEADHLLASVVSGLGLAGDPVAATHFVRAGAPHIALTIEVPAGAEVDPAAVGSVTGPAAGLVWGDLRQGPEDRVEGALAARAEHGRSGRLARFPGISTLTGTVTVREILERSPITEVSVLMGAAAAPDTEVATRDHVRPQWRDGAVVLVVQPVSDGKVAPFEVPNPTPCCAQH